MLLKNQDGILPLQIERQNHCRGRTQRGVLAALEGNYNGTAVSPGLSRSTESANIFAGKAKVLYAQGSPYVEQLPVPVPSNGVSPGRGRQPREGLKAEYFSNTDFSGKPVLTRVDPQIQFDWDAAAPVPGVSKKAFAVRWTGTLTPPGPGDYTFSVPKPRVASRTVAREAFRIYLDGQVCSRHHPARPQELD